MVSPENIGIVIVLFLFWTEVSCFRPKLKTEDRRGFYAASKNKKHSNDADAISVAEYTLRRLSELGIKKVLSNRLSAAVFEHNPTSNHKSNKLNSCEQVFGVPGDYSFAVNDAVEEVTSLQWIGCANEVFLNNVKLMF